MKSLSIIAFLTLLSSCHPDSKKATSNSEPKVNQTKDIHDTVYIDRSNTKDWQEGFGLSHDPEKDSIWHKPVSYYINDPNCARTPVDFYYGYFRPSDDGATEDLLKLACTNNAKLRPFYRWCLNKTLIVSDGALSELVGTPARQYAEKFPDEFFEYLDIAADSTKYPMWTEAIWYSGFFDYSDYDNFAINRKRLIAKMSHNLKVKSEKNLRRIEKFAQDCTHN